MSIPIARHLIFFACVFLLFINLVQAKPHGFKGSRKGRRGIQALRDAEPEYGATSTVRTYFTSTACTTGVTRTATATHSAGGRQCKRTKVAVLGAGVAGITAAVGLPSPFL